MINHAQARLTPEEYLDAERRAALRSEYHAGEVLMMAGASYAHNVIVANLITELGSRLRGGSCIVLPSDLRVWIASAERFVYPDVTVLCGEPQFFDAQQDTLINPVLLVEVMSKTTKNYDRGEKFELYRTLSSLQEYLLFDQEQPRCEHHRRREDGSWLLTEHRELEASVPLRAVSCELELAAIYANVPWSGPQPVHATPR